MENKKWSIQDIENEYLETRFSRQNFSDMWRGSDMGACARKRIYHRKKILPTEELSDRIRRVLEIGNMYHWRYQKLLKKLGFLIKKEGEIINKEYNYAGHFDALVGRKPAPIDEKDFTFTTDEGEKKIHQESYDWAVKKRKEVLKESPDGLPLLLYDFKTQHSRSFDYIKNKPQEEHRLQLLSYLIFAREQYPGIEEGRLMYISKDDSRIAEFPIKITPESEKQIKEELSYLNLCWKNNILPPQLDEIVVEPRRTSPNWKCSFCPYLTHCRGKNWANNTRKKIKDNAI